MREAALSAVIEVIRENLAIRGVYLLSESQLDLISGPEPVEPMDSAELARRVAEFAAAHGWSVTRQDGSFLLFRTSGEMDFSDF